MNGKRGDCIGGCGRKGVPYENVRLRLCPWCNRRRLNDSRTKKETKPQATEEARQKRIKQAQNWQKLRYRKPTGERQVFLEIWQERKHECEHCGIGLGEEPKAWMFAHEESKKQHPELRLEKTNIKLHCLDCHYIKDFGTEEQYEQRRNKFKP